MNKKKKKTITLALWTWRTNIYIAVLPLIIVGIIFTLFYITSMQLIGTHLSDDLKSQSDSQLKQSVGLETDLISQKMIGLRTNSEFFASQIGAALETPETPDNTLASRLETTEDGICYTPSNTGDAAVLYTGIVPPGAELRQKIGRILREENLMRNLYNTDPLVTSAFFTTYDSLRVIYPYDRAAYVFKPHTDLTGYNFYFEADPVHDPTRSCVWTDVYFDPVNKNLTVSSLTPVYQDNFLQGVVGFNMTTEMISRQVLRPETPWGGYKLLIGKNGEIINPADAPDLGAAKGKTDGEVLSLPRLNVSDKTSLAELWDKMSSSNDGVLKTTLNGDNKIVAWDTVTETGWKLMTVVPEKSIYENVYNMTSYIRNLGVFITVGCVLLYCILIYLLYLRSKKISRTIYAPLHEINRIVRNIAEGDYYQKAGEFDMREFRTTLDNLVEAGAELGRAHTELLETQQELKENKKYLQAVLEMSEDFIMEFDGDGAFIRYVVNAPISDLSAAEKTYEFYLDPQVAAQFRETVKTVFETGEFVTVDYDIKTRIGKRTCAYRMSRFDGNPPKVIITGRDITGRRLMLEEISQARDEAEKASKAKTQFLSNMSHELRTPLNAILGFAQVLEMDRQIPLAAPQKECVGEIIKAGTHLLDLINDILDLARIEAGKTKLTMEPVDIAVILQETGAIISPIAEQHSITLRIEETCPTGKCVKADETKLKQVLINLLSNAVKYNTPGGNVEYYCDEADGKIRFHVVDTGIGISPEDMKQIFKPFYRAPRYEKVVEGAGVGLSVVKQLIEMMRGRIYVNSKPGAGSHFWIELPAAKETGSVPETSDEPVNITARNLDTRKILCIEDNPANLRLLEMVLRQEQNFTVIAAMTGEDAMNAALKEKPDLVLMDINLPDMDGIDLCRKFREVRGLRDVPVIAVTSNAMEQDIRRARSAGFTDYITKPFNPKYLIATVIKLLYGGPGSAGENDTEPGGRL